MKAALILLVACLPLRSTSAPAVEPQKPPTEKNAKPDQVAVRLIFVPGGGPWKGEAPFQGASWSALGPGLQKGVLMLQARAGIGDKFPVQEKNGETLFDVILENGTDDHLVLLISSEE